MSAHCREPLASPCRHHPGRSLTIMCIAPCCTLKLLIAVQGKGEQAPHFGESQAARAILAVAGAALTLMFSLSLSRPSDRDDTESHLKRVYTVILYMTDDTNSTAFPSFPAADFAVPDYPNPDSAEVRNAAAMRRTVESGLLEKDKYDYWRTRVGDMYVCSDAHEQQTDCGLSRSRGIILSRFASFAQGVLHSGHDALRQDQRFGAATSGIL